MDFPLSYCPGGWAVLARLRALYVERRPDIVLASLSLSAPGLAFARFALEHPAGYCDYPDPQERIAHFWDPYLRERMAIRDDSVPSAYLTEMDQGLYGGLVGGDVRFLSDPDTGWISSMVPPLLQDWADFDRLAFSTDHPWWTRYLHQLDVFAAGSRGKFGISHFILIHGLNFVFELVGATRTYLSLIEEPERVRQAIDLSHEINLRVQETFFERVPLLEGGTCSNMVQWLPGRIISESVDPFHMTSVAYFERWGRPSLKRIFARFDGGVLHVHGNGRHLLEALADLPNLKAVYLGDDKGYAPAFEVLGDLKRRLGELPVVVRAPFEDFLKALYGRRLVGGVFYQVTDAPDVDTANRCMELVRGYGAGITT
ncbi:MAG: hypothetical protein ACM30E_09765 [Nitrososphaerales archaeon]